MQPTKRVSRLVQMVCLLQSGSGWKANALARRFGVSKTRIFNDIRVLKDAGMPVERTGAGYTLGASLSLPSLMLTSDETLEVLFHTERLAAGQTRPLVLRAARTKLLSCLPPQVRREAAQLIERTHIVLPRCSAGEGVLRELRAALAQCRRVVVVCEGRLGECLERLEFDPYGIAYVRGVWHVAGRSVQHDELRRLPIARMCAVEATRLHFSVPDGFSVADCFGQEEVSPGDGHQEVAVAFSARIGSSVRDIMPYPHQHVRTLQDGRVLYLTTVPDLGEIARWLMPYGSEVEVLYPQELADRMVAAARGILRAYTDESGARRRRHRVLADP